ncbi:type IV secretion system DNA-binding domain-containing protein [Patescibacteria group bacterium]|nr:type IV secretion system DNA-binding domain-containing protein [Patescibacteria group bacterium]MBU1966846.1 type IV secretion system DNA-binding domain-containing protein [Patescibacteria group bacterium]
MPAPHVLFEIRTSQDNQKTAEAAASLFSTFPKLRSALWWRLLNKNEHLSFELIVYNQTVYFQVYVPFRLSEYMKGAINASYPEALITPLEADPLEALFSGDLKSSPTSYLSLGTLKLKNEQYLPLKTYQDFADVDPLAPLLSTLSKTQVDEQMVVQFVLGDDGDGWKRKGFAQIHRKSTPLTELTELVNKSGSHPQKALIEKKLSTGGLKTSIRVAVKTPTKQRSILLLETIADSLGAISQSEGNELILRRVYLAKNWFTKAMKKRCFSCLSRQHLSLEELATLYHFPNEGLKGVPNVAWGKNLIGEPPENLPIITVQMDAWLKNEINPFARTDYKNNTHVYGIKRSDRRRHMYVIGKTGTGKSTLLANMAINDLKQNEGMCVIDPHGDLIETILDYIPSHRINDVVYFNPADGERTVKINLFEGKNVEHRELIASGIISVFKKLYSYSWGPRLEYILRNSLLTLLKVPQAKLSDVLKLLTDEHYRARTVESLDDPILKSFWEDEFNKLHQRDRTQQIASILNKVGQFVSSPLVRNVVNTSTSSFSIEEVMNEGKILLANLSQGKLGEDNATLLGAMLITKIQLAAMSRVNVTEEERRDFYLYVDEFQNFATDSFIKILSEARKYKLDLILANQYIAQIPEEVQKAIFGNCGNIASFVMGAEDAAAFEKEYGGKFTVEDLVSLGRYQIINKITVDGILSRPFPARTLSLAKSSNKNRSKVIKVSRERYATNRD